MFVGQLPRASLSALHDSLVDFLIRAALGHTNALKDFTKFKFFFASARIGICGLEVAKPGCVFGIDWTFRSRFLLKADRDLLIRPIFVLAATGCLPSLTSFVRTTPSTITNYALRFTVSIYSTRPKCLLHLSANPSTPTPIYAPTPNHSHQRQHTPAQSSPEHHHKCNTNLRTMPPTFRFIIRSLTLPLGPFPSRCSLAAPNPIRDRHSQCTTRRSARPN